MNPALSIVTTLYQSESYVDKFLDSALRAGEEFGGEFEIVLVDDGSPDSSYQIAKARAAIDGRIRAIQLTRNFGHHPAFWCAMELSRGDYCFLIDSDLEVNPEILSKFRSLLQSTKADVVYGVQEQRKGERSARLLGGVFWKLFSKLSDIEVPRDIMTERLMSRRYLDALLSMGDYNLFLGGMFFWPGFYQVPISITKVPRKDASTYNFAKRAKLLAEAVSSFSSMPLKLIFWMGISISILTGFYSVYLLFQKLVFPDTILGGFTFLALMSAMSFGLLSVSIGVTGLYIHKIFRQTQNRPKYIIKEAYSKLDE